MAKVSVPNLSVDQRFEILPPPQEVVLLVPLNQWRVYMERIKNCSESSRFFDSFGWASMGFGLSAILVAATFPFSVDFVRITDGSPALNVSAVVTEAACAVGALAGIIVGGVTLFYAKRHSKDRAEIRMETATAL